MTKARRRLVIGFVALAVVAGIAAEAYLFFDRRGVANEAALAAGTAMTSTSSATVPEDARRWLEANGYSVVVWNPRDPRGFVGREESTSDGKHMIVRGQRQIRAGEWLVKPTWLNLTFRFNLDRTFHDVQADSSPIQIRRAG